MLWVSCNSPECLDFCPDSPYKLGELLERVLANTFDGLNKRLLSGMSSIASISDCVLATANRFKQHDLHFLLATTDKTARETALSVIFTWESLVSL